MRSWRENCASSSGEERARKARQFPTIASSGSRFDLAKTIILTRQMGAGAAPLVLFGPRDQTGRHRIRLHIPRHRQKMGFIHGKGGEALLPEMAAPIFSKIDPTGVTAVRLANGPGQPVRGLRHRDQMDVIGHQGHHAQMSTLQ